MATTSIASDGDTIVSEIYISAPPENVFRALVSPELVVKWWGGQGAEQSFRCTRFDSDLRAGGKWRSSGVDGHGRPFEAAGEYVEVDHPQSATCQQTSQASRPAGWHAQSRPLEDGRVVWQPYRQNSPAPS